MCTRKATVRATPEIPRAANPRARRIKRKAHIISQKDE